MKIGLVRARFNAEITEKLKAGARKVLVHRPGVQILEIDVPGAVEIPLACQELFRQGCLGVVAVGAVIRGETTHYEMVCDSVNWGVTRLMLDWHRPIGFGVLTCETEEQAFDRVGGAHGHKGEEAAEVVLEMLGYLREMQGESNPLGPKTWPPEFSPKCP